MRDFIKKAWRPVAVFVAGGLTALGYTHAAEIIRIAVGLLGQ